MINYIDTEEDKEEDFDLVLTSDNQEKNYWTDIWRYRELFYILSWRDIKVRYKQTAIGATWSILRPLLTMIIFTVVFKKFAKMPTEGDAPYAIMVYAAMLPWQFFANSLSESANSLVGNAHLVSKVYFPRLIIPTSSVIVNFVDFIIAFVVLGILMIWFQFLPSWHIMFLPAFLLLAFLASFGVGLLLTTLNVRYRDFRHLVPFIVQFGLYLSPVGYSSSVVPDQWRILYSLNPMVGVIDGFRWAILGGNVDLYWPSILLSLLVSIILTWVGIRYFRKVELTFADVI